MHNGGNLTCDIKFLRVFFARYGFEWVTAGAYYGCRPKLNIRECSVLFLYYDVFKIV